MHRGDNNTWILCNAFISSAENGSAEKWATSPTAFHSRENPKIHPRPTPSPQPRGHAHPLNKRGRGPALQTGRRAAELRSGGLAAVAEQEWRNADVLAKIARKGPLVLSRLVPFTFTNVHLCLSFFSLLPRGDDWQINICLATCLRNQKEGAVRIACQKMRLGTLVICWGLQSFRDKVAFNECKKPPCEKGGGAGEREWLFFWCQLSALSYNLILWHPGRHW